MFRLESILLSLVKAGFSTVSIVYWQTVHNIWARWTKRMAIRPGLKTISQQTTRFMQNQFFGYVKIKPYKRTKEKLA